MLVHARVRAWVAGMTGHTFLLQLRHVAATGMSIDECDARGEMEEEMPGIRASVFVGAVRRWMLAG